MYGTDRQAAARTKLERGGSTTMEKDRRFPVVAAVVGAAGIAIGGYVMYGQIAALLAP